MTERVARTLAMGVVLFAIFAPTADAAPFQKRELPVESGRLFDLGVADYNRDGVQEVFTANHKYLGSVLTRSAGAWTDSLAALRLSQTQDYPGFEDLLHPPSITAPGLYIYGTSRTVAVDGEVHDDSRLDVVARDIGSIPLLDESARGTITLLSPKVRVTNREGAKVAVTRDDSTTPGRTIVRFEVAESAHLEFSARNVDMPPIIVSVDQAPLLSRTFVGADKVPATSSRFSLFLRDRHGWAWGDYDDDGRTDAFIARGGLGGQIRAYKGVIEDELMLWRGGSFSEQFAGSGLKKGGCRSRRTQSGDFDGDGNLDIFSSCKGSSPKLYLGDGSGHFRGVSSRLKRAGVGGVGYRWIDLRGGPTPELVTAEKRRVRVYADSGRGWKRVQSIVTRNRSNQAESLTYGDFDRDGDADVFVAVRSGSTLLVNRGGRLVARDPKKLGLPSRSLVGSFVDWNLDGLVDLHALPQGIYQQRADGRFRRTGLASSSPKHPFALASWFDFDNDGDRDLARTLKVGRGVEVRTNMIVNRRGPRGHWLAVELNGPPGNREGIGARVAVRARGKRYAWVGESDGARFSQGDYRVHFGLGTRRRVRRVTVTWPTGEKTKVGPILADRRIVISADS